LLFAFLAVACSSNEEEKKQPPAEVLTGTLDVDIRDTADVAITTRADTLTATLTISNDWGVLPKGEAISGKGRVERFPEADVTLYTALIDVSAQSGGPCGSDPLTLALALERSGAGGYVVGSLTPYCGKNTDSGNYARNPLRLSGQLPLPSP
jgi:hypothetical protein